MMTEKERGSLEGAEFGTLWEISTDLKGQKMYVDPKRILYQARFRPANFIVLATDMSSPVVVRALVLFLSSVEY